METDAATLRSVAFGREPIVAAERDGRLTVGGDRRAGRALHPHVPRPRRLARPVLSAGDKTAEAWAG